MCKKFDLRTLLALNDEEWSTSSDCGCNYYWDEQAQALCYEHSDHMLQVEQSASAGCPLCILLFTAFQRKGSDAAKVAGNLPIVLVGCTETMDDLDDSQLNQIRQTRPLINAYLVSSDEGLLKLCDLDICIDDGM